MNRAFHVLQTLALLLLLPLAAQAADVTLMPVNVSLDHNNDRTTVQVMKKRKKTIQE